MPEDCIDQKRDDPIAFGLMWQIFRLLDKLSEHVGGEGHQSFQHCKEALYEMSISVEERLMSPLHYSKQTSILSYYYSGGNPHPYRRFH